ncbi:hypothetical protein ACFL4G_07270 [Thermodesulfobacteriota bacterium]
MTARLLTILSLLVISPWPADAARADVEVRRTLARTSDPVTVRGERIRAFSRVPIEGLRLYAEREGALIPIPFQVDEIDLRGLYVLPEGKRPNRDAGDKQFAELTDGLVDANDELVFMAGDLGGRVGSPEAPTGCGRALEVEVVDPIDGGRGWAYLFECHDPPPRSERDYVDFDPARDLIDAEGYVLGYSPDQDLVYTEHIAIKEEGGGDGSNLIDRMNIRFHASILIKSITFSRNEDDFVSEVISYKDGPVRVMRRVGNRMRLVLGLRSPEIIAYSVYYGRSIESPNTFNMPVSMKAVVKDVDFVGSTDYSSSAIGMLFYSSGNRAGSIVDGISSPQEDSIDREDNEWTVLTGPQGTILTRLVLGPKFRSQIGNRLHYVDDKATPNRPENEHGQYPTIGFIPTNLMELAPGLYHYNVHIYVLPGYRPGDEKTRLDILDTPLQTRINPLGPTFQRP